MHCMSKFLALSDIGNRDSQLQRSYKSKILTHWHGNCGNMETLICIGMNVQDIERHVGNH